MFTGQKLTLYGDVEEGGGNYSWPLLPNLFTSWQIEQYVWFTLGNGETIAVTFLSSAATPGSDQLPHELRDPYLITPLVMGWIKMFQIYLLKTCVYKIPCKNIGFRKCVKYVRNWEIQFGLENMVGDMIGKVI